MPLFMMISGFFFAMTCRRGFWKLSAKKARQLLLPVLCWILIFTIARRITIGLPSFVELRSAYLIGLWFLKSAFVCSIIGYFTFVMMRQHLIWGGVISLIISQLANSPLLQISYMYPCFLAGGALWINYDTFKKHIASIAIVSGTIFISANIFLDSYVYSTAKNVFDSLDMLTSDTLLFFGWRIYRLVMGICGGVFLIALTEFIFSKPRSGRLVDTMSECGKMTLGIYILQSFILETILARHLNLDRLNFYMFNFIAAPLISLAVIALSVFIIRIIQHNAWASALLLGTPFPYRTRRKQRTLEPEA